ncbi:Lipopolysaccharide export LptBFGC system, permease protein LptF [Salinihabitans flavidus]|uniref:Lipopolysaccharide export LptBFGC system, permease protein LptF n=1 Tax=Salinihabitans flavidus TaxID=569882 RepID=A0A1H8QTW4_9RHOB|nr:LptF/LptG family permease [Salinihabitans flavidus]SEO57700.1 Lipopolysaccharide export LptBFGC system, permease protein LptF [Salinihabitans flavidus]
MRALTGIAMRSIMLAHLRAIGFVVFLLLAIAFSIDLSENLTGLQDKAAETGQPLWRILFPYLGYRGVDILTRLLPMACLAGAFAAELLRFQRLEPVILAAAGATPALALSALLVVGVITGTVQAALEGWLRPAAVFAQVDLGVGSYARRFERKEKDSRWFVADDRALRATVQPGQPPTLRDVVLFEGIRRAALSSLIVAESARPGADPQSWVLKEARRWEAGPNGNLRPEPPQSLTIRFPLTSVHLTYLDVGGFYIPQEALRRITAVESDPRFADRQTALVRRYAAFFLPGVFALLGASLAQTGTTARRFNPLRLVALAVTGYISVVLIKIFWSLGEFGAIAPLWASLASLLIAGTLAAILQIRQL